MFRRFDRSVYEDVDSEYKDWTLEITILNTEKLYNGSTYLGRLCVNSCVNFYKYSTSQNFIYYKKKPSANASKVI